MSALLEVQDLLLRRGNRCVAEIASLQIEQGEVLALVGPNGAGKSSLLRIMAGLDDGYSGEARLTPGFTVGYLPQEPQLDPSLTVKGNVMQGVAAVQGLIDRYNEVMGMWADPDADYEKVGALQAELEDKIAAADAWSLERNVEIEYLRPLMADQNFVIKSFVSEWKRTQLICDFTMTDEEGQTMSTAKMRVGCIDKATLKPCAWPDGAGT